MREPLNLIDVTAVRTQYTVVQCPLEEGYAVLGVRVDLVCVLYPEDALSPISSGKEVVEQCCSGTS